jgi:4-amino-4-deoxy-L-arabinose transferase-like glycosyltransferase
MASAALRTTVAVTLGVVLVAAVLSAVRLSRLDARGHAAWADPRPLVLDTGSPTPVTVFLPACPIRGVAVRTDAPPATRLQAVIEVPPPAGPVQHQPQIVQASNAGTFLVRIPDAPRRQVIHLHLQALDRPVTLSDDRPLGLDLQRRSLLGLLPCAFDEGSSRRALVLATLVLGVLGVLGWLAAHVSLGAPLVRRASTGAAVAAAVTAAASLVYVLVVPPYEPPDELAHFQYARFVATTGTLPTEVPAPDSEWRDSSYEWVQQPLYYIGAATLLRLSGLHQPAPAPQLNPRSRLSGGTEVSIFAHGDRPDDAVRGLLLLRVISVLMVAGTAWFAARAVTLVTGAPSLGLLAGAGLALVPQWTAVMGSVSTDPPATCAAAGATYLMVRATVQPGQSRGWLLTGLLAGAAYAFKATSAFILPMGVFAAWWAAPHDRSHRLRRAGAFTAGVLTTTAWIPLHAWMTVGDPLARDFKRALLEAGGFVVRPGPPLLSHAFLEQLRLMVFEAFWARFGSLGAGPFPGTRLWWLYGLASVGLALGLLGGAGAAVWAPVARQTAALRVCAAGVAIGLSLWAWINLVPQADVVVHWTPRHILPLTVPMLILVAVGVQQVHAVLPERAQTWLRGALAAGMVALAVAGLAVLHSVILGFHFGY